MRKHTNTSVELVYRHCLQTIDASPNISQNLESEWSLARRFSVSRRVARRALQQLVREGRAVCRAGKGYVSRPVVRSPVTQRVRVGIVHHPPRRAYSGIWNVFLAKLCESLESHEFTSSAIPIQMLENGLVTQRMLADFSADAYLLCSLSPATQAFFASQKKPTVVLGNTIRDLGLASISLDELDIARQVTEQLLAKGCRLITLVQEKTLNLGAERGRIGFLYAHHAQLARYHPDRVVRIDRERKGMSQELLRMFKLSPCAILVESIPLLEMIWSRATATQQRLLESTEVIVLSADFTGELRHPAKFIQYDVQWESEAAIQLLEDCVRGRKTSNQHLRIPWSLVERK